MRRVAGFSSVLTQALSRRARGLRGTPRQTWCARRRAALSQWGSRSSRLCPSRGAPYCAQALSRHRLRLATPRARRPRLDKQRAACRSTQLAPMAGPTSLKSRQSRRPLVFARPRLPVSPRAPAVTESRRLCALRTVKAYEQVGQLILRIVRHAHRVALRADEVLRSLGSRPRQLPAESQRRRAGRRSHTHSSADSVDSPFPRSSLSRPCVGSTAGSFVACCSR